MFRTDTCTMLRPGMLVFLALTGSARLIKAAPRDEPPPEGATLREVEIGKNASKTIEAFEDFKLVKDSPHLPRLRGIVQRLTAVTERPKVTYEVKVFQDKDPNAFTLPGAYIYVSTGLLDFVRSDHELTAVLAHEIAHNTRMHHMKMAAKERKYQFIDILTTIGATLAASQQSREAYRTNDPGKVYAPILFQQSLMAGLVNRYSVEHERDADATAFTYLKKIGSNPVGLLTFMERLRILEQRRPEIEYGVFMTHPPTPERVEAARKRLQEMGISIQRAAVTTVRLTVESLPPDAGVGARVRAGQMVLFTLSGPSSDEATARARTAIDQFEKASLKGLRSFDLQLRPSDSSVEVLAGREVLVTATAEDVRLNQMGNANELAELWVENVRKLLLRDSLIGING